MNPKLSILLPIYNEEGNIVPLLEELEEALTPLKHSFEVIAVDDGSTDRSREILAELSRTKHYLKVVLFRRNYGQTAAFDAGFSHASGDIIITMDSDRQNDPNDIPLMLKMIDQGYDFVAGWRLNRKDGFVLRTFPSRIANGLIRWVMKTSIHDLGCSLKAYRRELSNELRLYGEMHRFIGILMEGMGARVGEMVVNHRPRTSGQSKYNLSRTVKVLLDLTTVWFMQRYRTKPSYIFGGTGFAMLGVSGLIAAFVLYEKLALAVWVHRNPLFNIAVFLAIVGIQFVALGIISELIIRTYFESSQQRPYLILRTLGFPLASSKVTLPRESHREPVLTTSEATTTPCVE